MSHIELYWNRSPTPRYTPYVFDVTPATTIGELADMLVKENDIFVINGISNYKFNNVKIYSHGPKPIPANFVVGLGNHIYNFTATTIMEQ